MPAESRDQNDNDIDLVCNFSLSFETYPYVVDEVAACGVPSLLFDFGAGAERVKRNRLGWTMKYTDDVELIADKIYDILRDERQYNETIKAINRYQVRGVEEMANDYEGIYKKEAVANKLNYDILKSELLKVRLSVIGEMELGEKVKQSREAFYELGRVRRSLRWRAVEKIILPKWVSRCLRIIARDD